MSRPPRPAALRIRYLDANGASHLVDDEEAARVMFEDCPPVRTPASYPGQWHTPGRYWSSTAGNLLAYESFLECQWLTLLDHDRSIIALNTQTLELRGRDSGGTWRHVPDIFVRRIDGSVQLVDVKHPSHHTDPDVTTQTRRTEHACRRLGWAYRMVGTPPRQFLANVAWLAGYRRPLRAATTYRAQLLEAAVQPVTLGELAEHSGAPELTRPVIFHLLWWHQLRCDLETAPLNDRTLIHTSEEDQR